MEILIQEESLIPDFVIDGDTMVNPQRQLIGIDHGFYDYDREAEDDYFFGDDSFFDNEDAEYELRRYGDRMKKIAIVLLGVSIGLVGFIVGFFAA
jgi:hypothetical protein